MPTQQPTTPIPDVGSLQALEPGEPSSSSSAAAHPPVISTGDKCGGVTIEGIALSSLKTYAKVIAEATTTEEVYRKIQEETKGKSFYSFHTSPQAPAGPQYQFGKADYFVSHPRGGSFLELVRSVDAHLAEPAQRNAAPGSAPAERYLWIDIFMDACEEVDKLPVEELDKRLDEVIRKIKGRTRSQSKPEPQALVVASPLTGARLPCLSLWAQRAWCLVEFFHVTQAEMKFHFVVSHERNKVVAPRLAELDAGELADLLREVDLGQAQTRTRDQAKEVAGMVKTSRARFNAQVVAAVRDFLCWKVAVSAGKAPRAEFPADRQGELLLRFTELFLDSGNEVLAKRAAEDYTTGCAGKTAELATGLFVQGHVAQQLKQYEEAKDFYMQALDAFKDANADRSHTASVASTHNRLGFVLGRLEKWQESIKEYSAEVEVRMGVQGGEVALAGARASLAGAYFANKEWEKAVKELKNACELLDTGKDDGLLAGMQHNLATALVQSKQWDEARKALNDCLKTKERLGEDQSQSAATTYANRAYVWFQLEEYEEARKDLEEAKIILVSILGEKHVAVARVNNDLGNVLTAMDNHDKAREVYDKSVAVKKNAADADCDAAARGQQNLGQFLQQRGDNDYMDAYEKAWLGYELVHGPKSKQIEELQSLMGMSPGTPGRKLGQSNLGTPPRTPKQSLDVNQCSKGPEPGKFWEFQPNDIIAYYNSANLFSLGFYLGSRDIGGIMMECVRDAKDGSEYHFFDTHGFYAVHNLTGVRSGPDTPTPPLSEPTPSPLPLEMTPRPPSPLQHKPHKWSTNLYAVIPLPPIRSPKKLAAGIWTLEGLQDSP